MKTQMKLSILTIAMFAFILNANVSMAQDDKAQRPSPPAKASEKVGSTTITVDYSQPSVKGRTIWGDLVPYGKIWRAGANEATTFEASTDVSIDGKTLKAGKYALFVIPEANSWTFVFNSVPNQWGAYNHDASKDVLKVKVTPKKLDENVEKLTYKVKSDGGVYLKWSNMKGGFKVSSVQM